MGRINYAEHVPAPDGESIARMKNLFSVVFNVRDAMDYGKSALLNGRDCRGKNLVLGDRFFVQSGFCDNETSEPACRNQPRYLFVDNVPSNVPPCMDTSKNQAVHSRCRENENSGMIPGLLQDIAQINPFELLYSMVGSGSIVNKRCVRRREKVGYQAGDVQNFHYETRCAPERAPLICSIKTTTQQPSPDTAVESFTSDRSNAVATATNRWSSIFAVTIVLLLLGGLLLMYRYLKQ